MARPPAPSRAVASCGQRVRFAGARPARFCEVPFSQARTVFLCTPNNLAVSSTVYDRWIFTRRGFSRLTRGQRLNEGRRIGPVRSIVYLCACCSLRPRHRRRSLRERSDLSAVRGCTGWLGRPMWWRRARRRFAIGIAEATPCAVQPVRTAEPAGCGPPAIRLELTSAATESCRITPWLIRFSLAGIARWRRP
jgi:hypothetical protein